MTLDHPVITVDRRVGHSVSGFLECLDLASGGWEFAGGGVEDLEATWRKRSSLNLLGPHRGRRAAGPTSDRGARTM